MTEKYKKRMFLAATNAAEMIRGHAESGLEPEDINEVDENGITEYVKACTRIAQQIEKLAKKYKP